MHGIVPTTALRATCSCTGDDVIVGIDTNICYIILLLLPHVLFSFTTLLFGRTSIEVLCGGSIISVLRHE
jgi:hypothetical protein